MDWLVFFVFLAATFAAASTGAMFSPGAWYERLDKPAWTPPNWLFPVAWTILYIAMAAAAARIATLPDPGLGLAFWALQIALNAIWSPVFFGLRRIDIGLIVIAFLWLAVTATMIVFFLYDATAGWLLAPYVFWVSYASALNYAVWSRNKDRLPDIANAAS
ncbi:MAG: TspO/MBR family protein [Pseudomonadota bacterium]